jgi:hypothetical protein
MEIAAVTADKAVIAQIRMLHAAESDRPMGVSLHRGIHSFWARLDNPNRSSLGLASCTSPASRHAPSPPPSASRLQVSANSTLPPPVPALCQPPASSPARSFAAVVVGQEPEVMSGPPSGLRSREAIPEISSRSSNRCPTPLKQPSLGMVVRPLLCRMPRVLPLSVRPGNSRQGCRRLLLISLSNTIKGASDSFWASTGCPFFSSYIVATESAVRDDGATTCCSTCRSRCSLFVVSAKA